MPSSGFGFAAGAAAAGLGLASGGAAGSSSSSRGGAPARAPPPAARRKAGEGAHDEGAEDTKPRDRFRPSSGLYGAGEATPPPASSQAAAAVNALVAAASAAPGGTRAAGIKDPKERFVPSVGFFGMSEANRPQSSMKPLSAPLAAPAASVALTSSSSASADRRQQQEQPQGRGSGNASERGAARAASRRMEPGDSSEDDFAFGALSGPKTIGLTSKRKVNLPRPSKSKASKQGTAKPSTQQPTTAAAENTTPTEPGSAGNTVPTQGDPAHTPTPEDPGASAAAAAADVPMDPGRADASFDEFDADMEAARALGHLDDMAIADEYDADMEAARALGNIEDEAALPGTSAEEQNPAGGVDCNSLPSKEPGLGSPSQADQPRAQPPPPPVASPLEIWKRFTPDVIDKSRCLARIWLRGRGGQCSVPVPGGRELCCSHEQLSTYGRVDGPVPLAQVAAFEAAYARHLAASQCTPEKPAKGRKAAKPTPDKTPQAAGAKAAAKAGGAKKRLRGKAAVKEEPAAKSSREEAAAGADVDAATATPARRRATAPPAANEADGDDGNGSAAVEDAAAWKRFTPAEIDRTLCLGRTWGGGQCRRKPTEGHQLCKTHQRHLSHGQVDGPIPAAKLKQFEAAAARSDKRGASESQRDSAAKTEPPSKRRRVASKGAAAESAQPEAAVAEEGRPEGQLVEASPGEATKARKQPKKKSQAKVKVFSLAQRKKQAEQALKEKVPYGVNLVKANLRRNTMAWKGSKISELMRKYYDKDGRLKGKYRQMARPKQHDEDHVLWDSKHQRNKSRRERAMAEESLVDTRTYKVESFSHSVGPDILAKLEEGEEVGRRSRGLGEIAESRPPDIMPLQWEAPVAAPAAGGAAPRDAPLPLQDSQAPAIDASGAAAHEASQEGDAPGSHVTASPPQSPQKATEGAEPASQDTAPPPQSPQKAAEGASTQAAPATGYFQDVVGPLSSKKPEEHSPDDLKAVLRNYFGHVDFRPGQSEAVSSVLAGKKTLLLLSTGSGKSLCYQLPAFLLREEGFTLVVSPLVSLMADQLLRLPRCLRGAVVSGQQTQEECRNVMRAVRARLIDVLFISPERLSLWAFDGCGLPPIALACVDEAHCVSEWSHNFRPDYLRLHEFLTGSLNAKRLMALTATATRPTIKSVCKILRLDVVVRCDRSFSLQELLDEPAQPRVQRPNLTMDVRYVSDEDVQVKELVRILRENSRGSAIVYVWRKVTADHLSKQLRGYLRGYGDVRAYHGSLTPEVRRSVQDAFMRGRVRVVVATTAFGMGLDKPDIRTVVHYNVPKSIENYIQETGRCARDGEPGLCVALVSPKDYKSMRWMECGGGGGTAKAGLVRRLLAMIFKVGDTGPQKRYELSDEAALSVFENYGEADASCGGEQREPLPDGWRPFFVAFEEKDAARTLNCPEDEMHSALVHFAHRTSGHVKLLSRFPTRLKLRFYKADPADLMKQDPFLRKVLPLAKKHGPVHTIETAQAVAQIGGQPGQLSNALWAAQGEDFTVVKSDYGYMVAVLKPADERMIEQWADDISSINANAKSNSIHKVDAVYFALRRAVNEARDAAWKVAAGEPLPLTSGADGEQEIKPRASEGVASVSVDGILNGIIDAYFSATEDPSAVVAGGAEERKRFMRDALGEDFQPERKEGPLPITAGEGPSEALQVSTAPVPRPRGNSRPPAQVYPTVARLIMSQDWPDSMNEDTPSIAHAVAQILAGIGSVLFPAKEWRRHECWATYRNFGDFQQLEDLVALALPKLLEGKKKLADKERAKESATRLAGGGPRS